jgi:hypothetical protein
MAIISRYENENELIENAYYKVQNIKTSNVDYEFFEVVNDNKDENIYEKLAWETRIESFVTVYIWPDKESRKNRASIITWFNIPFNYEIKDSKNIYEQAYLSLERWIKNKYSNDVNVENV